MTESVEYKTVLQILKEKNAAPHDLDKDREFFTAALTFLERHDDCIWCRYPQLCGDLLRLFSFQESPPLVWFRAQTVKCLTSCRNCIELYYGIRPKLWATFRKVYQEHTVVDFQNKLEEFDIQRLREPFQHYVNDRAHGWKLINLKFGLFEVFLFPGWIEHETFGPLFELALESLIEDKRMIKISERLPGIVACALHPKMQIRDWAQEVLAADAANDQEQTAPDCQRINYSWDTLVRLGRRIALDSDYLAGMLVCLKKSTPDFVKSCSNYNWLSRVLSPLAARDETSVKAFLCVCELFKTLDAQTMMQIPPLLESTEFILSNQYIFASKECVADLNTWIKVVVNLHSQNSTFVPFKNGHRLIGLILDFAVDSQIDVNVICTVVCEFTKALSTRLDHPYLLNKLTHLLLFLADRKGVVRTSKETEEVVDCGKLALTHLLKADFDAFKKSAKESVSTAPKTATFDPTVYKKYCLFLEKFKSCLGSNFISGMVSVFDKSDLDDFVSGFWYKREPIVFLFMDIMSGERNPLNADTKAIHAALLIYFIFDQSQFHGIDACLERLLQSVPDKFIVALADALKKLISTNFNIAGKLVPLSRILHVLCRLIIPSFEKENLLRLDPAATSVIYAFWKNCIGPLFLHWDALLAVSSVYYRFGEAICHLGLSWLKYFNVNLDYSDRDYWADVTKALIMLLFRRGRALIQHLEARQELFELGGKMLGLCGRLSWTESQVSDLNKSFNVLATSSLIALYQRPLLDGIITFNKASNYKFTVPDLAPTPNTAPKVLPAAAPHVLVIPDDIEETVLNRLAIQESATAASSSAKPTSKLGQIRQELAKEVVFVKKSRPFTPLEPASVKAPRMLSKQDLERGPALHSDESDIEERTDGIEASLFRNVQKPVPSAGHNHSSVHTGRSVKVISMEGTNGTTKIAGSGTASSLGQFRHSREQRELLSIQRLQRYILSLDYAALDEPSFADASRHLGTTIPATFESFEAYRATFEPLLQLECRAQLTQAVEENQGRVTWIKGNVVTVGFVDDWHELVFNFGNDGSHKVFTDLDVIAAHPVHNVTPAHIKDLHVLGIITQAASRSQGFEVTVRFSLKSKHPDLELAARDKISWKAAKLCNLITSNREYQAMLSLQLHNRVSENVLHPRWRSHSFDHAKQSLLERLADQYEKRYGVNASQAQAIAFALNNTDNFFTLIQGPPGTGKTRTIEGFLAAYFAGLSAHSGATRIVGPIVDKRSITTNRKRVLLCAPSNAAIDEIVRRLSESNRKRSTDFKIIRIGAPDMIHADVREYSLDALVDKRLSHDANDLAKRGQEPQTQPSKEQAYRTAKAMEDLRQSVRMRILSEAQVVCCTLSASGHDMLGRIDGDFELVVIDEACQAVELSALIPLQYGAKRCVLIGDPNQLPPTVISNATVAATYEQSLFQRIQKLMPNAVRLLSIQYRMHPEISLFPSKYFYDGRLQNGPGMAEATRKPWHANGALGPCRFFDVPVGEESLRQYAGGRQGHSMMNQAEAKIAVALVVALAHCCPDYNVRKLAASRNVFTV